MDKNSEYGLIYSEVARGYSKKYIDNQIYYFKHPTQVEYFSIYHAYESIYAEAKSKGLLTEQEKIDQAINGGWWSSENESKIAEINIDINHLIKTKNQLLYPSQKAQVEEQIQKNQRILVTYTKERNSITGYTVETYANEKFYDELLINLTFKNSELTERVFADESEYYYLSEDIVENIRKQFSSNNSKLSMENLKLVSATGFFQNLLFLADATPVHFWGKPTIYCSRHQIDILMYGKMIKNLIKYHAENGNQVDEEILNNPEKLIKLLDNNASITATTSRHEKSDQTKTRVTSYVGATQEDLKEMGVRVEKIGGKSLLELAEENGGILDKDQYFKVREGM